MSPPQTTGVYLSLLADDTCMRATDREEGHVLRMLQRGLNSIETWCKRWGIKINKEKLAPSVSVIDLDHVRFISH
jgi:hypothetical protein